MEIRSFGCLKMKRKGAKRMGFRWLHKVEEYSAGILFLGGFIVSLYSVFMRYVLNLPPAWSLEIFELLMVWSIFIGFGIALRENHHIVIDLLYDKLPYTAKRAVCVASNFIGAAYCIFMTVTGVQMIALAFEQQIVTIDVGIPIWVTYLIMPVGMALLALYFIFKGILAIKGDRTEIIGQIGHDIALDGITDDKGKGGLHL